MPSERLKQQWIQASHYAARNLNFYRIHLLVFCLSPLVISAIMFASNGHYRVSYGEPVNC